MTVVRLSAWDLALAAGFVLASGALSLALGLGLARRLAVAALRTVVQLSLLGLVLRWLFAAQSALAVLPVLGVMLLVAGREAASRPRRGYPGLALDATLALALSALVVGTLVTQAILDVEPWFAPRYVIPLVGMILGNALNGVSLALDHFLDHLESRREEVELRLTFAATRAEALRPSLRAAARRGLIPIVNAMSVAGVVSLPGMMTGQILAGAPPMQAVAYQILVMFMLAGAYTLGIVGVLWLAGRRLLSPDGRLALERLRARR